jgi:hypothetical protein
MLDRESRLRADGDRASANAGIAAAAAAIDRGDASGAMRHLELVPESQRGWVHAWLTQQTDRSVAILELGDADVISVDIVPADPEQHRLETLLITSYRGTWAFDLPSLDWRWNLPEFSKGGSWKHLLMPGEDRLVVCGLGPEVLVADFASGRVLARFDTPGSIGSMAVIDDRTVLLGGDDGVLSSLDLDSGEIRHVAHPGAGAITSMCRMPDGRILLGTQRGVLFETDDTLAEPREVRRFDRIDRRDIWRSACTAAFWISLTPRTTPCSIGSRSISPMSGMPGSMSDTID